MKSIDSDLDTLDCGADVQSVSGIPQSYTESKSGILSGVLDLRSAHCPGEQGLFGSVRFVPGNARRRFTGVRELWDDGVGGLTGMATITDCHH